MSTYKPSAALKKGLSLIKDDALKSFVCAAEESGLRVSEISDLAGMTRIRFGFKSDPKDVYHDRIITLLRRTKTDYLILFYGHPQITRNEILLCQLPSFSEKLSYELATRRLLGLMHLLALNDDGDIVANMAQKKGIYLDYSLGKFLSP